jgi:hypothetical protein
MSFENEAFIFPGVHHSLRFALLTLGAACEIPEFIFFARHVSDLEDPRRRFTLTPAEIARINPNTKTAPVFRSRADADLTAAIYNRVPVLIEETSGPDGNPWGVSFLRMFDMATDSALFRTSAQLAEDGWHLDVADWVLEGGERYVPLYEAKMIHQFDHRWATFDAADSRDATSDEKEQASFEPTPRYWVPELERSLKTARKKWSREWLMGWRDITSAHVLRTTIATVIPRAGAGDTLLLLLPSEGGEQKAGALLANLNSLVQDYACRQKIGGNHLKYNVFQQLPILPPSAYDEADLAYIVPRVLELTYTSHSMAPFACDLGYHGAPFPWNEVRRAQIRAELDAWYALAYGLTREELSYVLNPKDVMGADYPSETFRVLQNNEIKQFGEFRTRRLVLAAYDELTSQGMSPRTEGYR